jgi:hypothetical protein
MMYAPDEHDVDPAAIERAKALETRFAPLAEGSPQWGYLTETRRLSADAVRRCSGDLATLGPPIPHFPAHAYGVVSILRDGAGEGLGFATEACGPAGEAVRQNGRTLRRFFNTSGKRLSAGLWCAASDSKADRAVLVEGHLAKAIAAAAVLPDWNIYGFGSRSWLGKALPPETELLVIEDRLPEDSSDDAAEAHRADMERGIDRLLLEKKRVSRVPGPGCGCCKDMDEALAKHSAEELRAGLEASATEAELSRDGEARRCAKIKDPLKQAEAIAILIGDGKIPRGVVAGFRAAVAKYAGKVEREEDDAELPGDAVEPEDVLPWHEPVDGAQLVASLKAYITAHAIVPAHAALVCALWVLHAHAHDAAYHSPRLVLRSPTKGCGKSTLRRVLSRLVVRPYEAIDITGPTLFRPIGQWHPTVFVDEANEIDWSTARDLVGVINSGHCRDDPGVPRCVGPDLEVRLFRVWAPLCLALIGFLPSTIAERSIVIEMRKKLRATPVQRLLRNDRDAGAHELARRCARWAVDHQITLENAEPELPMTLGDRPADNWRPLLAVADLLELGKEARAAAVALAVVDDDGEDLGLQLLADIYLVFQKLGKKQLTSAQIVAQLLQMEGRPWPEYGRMQRPFTANAMARLLQPFKIWPAGTIRDGGKTAKGYHRAAFEGAWKQYSLSETQLQPSHRHNPGEQPVSEGSQPSHSTEDVTVADGPKAAAAAGYDGVTVAAGSQREKENTSGSGNGLDPDEAAAVVAAEIADGYSCAHCAGAFTAEHGSELDADGRLVHRGGCNGAQAEAPPAKPKRRRSRVKGADTTPTVQKLARSEKPV